MRNILKELSNKHGLDERIVREICNSPFKFAKQVCQDPDDRKPLRFKYLFTISLKSKYLDDKTKVYPKAKRRIFRG